MLRVKLYRDNMKKVQFFAQNNFSLIATQSKRVSQKTNFYMKHALRLRDYEEHAIPPLSARMTLHTFHKTYS